MRAGSRVALTPPLSSMINRLGSSERASAHNPSLICCAPPFVTYPAFPDSFSIPQITTDAWLRSRSTISRTSRSHRSRIFGDALIQPIGGSS